jgi:predicted MPP superfamily phosphohydrolase
MSDFSLFAALVWGTVAGTAVVAAGWARRSGARRGDRVEAGDASPAAAHGAGDGGRRPAQVVLGDLVIGGIVAAVAFAGVFLVCHLTIRFTVFGSIAITYLALVVGVPLAMTIVLLAGAWSRRRAATGGARSRVASRPALVVCGAGLLLAPVGYYATHVEPFTLDVERPEPLRLAAEREGEEAFTVGVLTDLQTPRIGEREREVVDELMATSPDVILIPGDIIQNGQDQFEEHLPELRELLGRLRAPGGVYLVGGDADEPVERLPAMVEGTGVRYLGNEVVTATVRDRTLTIGGLALDYESAAALAVVEQLESEPGADDVRILLSHRPDPVLALHPDSRIDLQVSGHTHGGQVSLPFVGPLMTLSDVPRHIAAGGLHELGGNAVYVGKGVGLERGNAPQVRFGVRPNIGVLTLEG